MIPTGLIAGFLLALFLAVEPQPTTAESDCPSDPEVLQATPSVYPEGAVGAGLQGEVIIRVNVDANGKVTDTEVLKGEELLSAPAEKAAREWKFAPAEKAVGKPAGIRTAFLTFLFRIMPEDTPSKEIGNIFVPPHTMAMRRTKLRLSVSKSDCCDIPAVLKAVPAKYPDVALATGLQSEVLIKVTVGEDGNVADTELLKGIALLNPSAKKAAREWKFAPTVERVVGEPRRRRTAFLIFLFRIMPRDTPPEELESLFVPPYTMEIKGERPEILVLD
jgi:TonB family protein